MKLRLLLLPLLALAACKGTGGRSAPHEPLEKGLFFEERDEFGRPHAISAKGVGVPASDAPPPAVERVADGATVDVNSTLRIGLRRDELGSPSGRIVQTGLLEQARTLRAQLDGFARIVEAEARATEGWQAIADLPQDAPERAAAYERFADQRRAYGSMMFEFLGAVRALWPRETRPQEVEDVVDLLLNDDPDRAARQVEARERFGRLLQERVDAVSAELERLEDEARTVIARRKLRIEAFVIPSEDAEKQHAVHVAGYDELDEQTVQAIDRRGLMLTETERRFLLETAAASKEIADALERVRKGEADLSEALAGATTGFGQALAAKAKEAEALAADLKEEKLKSDLAETKAALERFMDAVRARFQGWVEQREAALKTAFDEAATGLEDLDRLLAWVDTAKRLRDRWEAAASGDMPALALESLAAAEELEGIVRELRLADLQAAVGSLIENEIRAAEPELRDALTDSLESSGLGKQVEHWKELLARTRSAFEDLKDLLGGPPHPSVPTDLSNPESFDVPLDIAPDAEIRLQRTTRKAGDHLHVQAKLLEAGPDGEPGSDREIDDFSATLRLEKLGWHADVVPSIVFVTADQLAGADDSGGFSASLGWMWSYGPRDDDDDPYLSRSLDWSAGLHAVFLNFGPDNDPEIGLGAAVGLWENRIQLGAGLNPFADDRQDGQFYYYIGSSLVPLLQALAGDAE